MLKSLHRKTINDLKAHWRQFLAVWMVVTLGTTFYGAGYPSGMNMIASILSAYRQLDYMSFQIQLTAATPGISERADAIPGVQAVEDRLVVEGGLRLDANSDYLTNLRLISIPDNRPANVNRSAIIQGRAIRSDSELWLLESFANKHGIRPGDGVLVWVNGREHSLRVAGLVFNPEYMVAGRSSVSPFPTLSSFGVAWMHYSELSQIAGRENQVNQVLVRLNDDFSANRYLKDAVRRRLEKLYDDEPGFSLQSELQSASGGVVDANMNGNIPLMIFFSTTFLVGALVVTGILLARLVQSEHQRIGTLRAMGVTQVEIVQHYLLFGLLLGSSGAAVGSVLGYLNSLWVIDIFTQNLIGGTLPGYVNTPNVPFILAGFVIMTLTTTLTGIIPAWRESRTPPGIALRPATPKSPSALSRIPLHFLPLTLRQTARNLLRVPGRSVGTAMGVLTGAMMIFVSLVMWDTMEASFGDFFRSSEYDLRVIMAQPQSANALERRAVEVDGVRAAQAALIVPTAIQRQDEDDFDALLISVDGRQPFLRLETVAGQKVYSNDGGVWIGHNVRRVLGVDVGDDIEIEVFDKTHTVRVLGIVSEVMGCSVFAPRGLVESWNGHIFPANTLLVRTTPGKKIAVRDGMADLPGMVAVDVMDEYEADIDKYLWFYRSGTLIFGSFGYILTLAVLFNTVNASLHERENELSILRAMGMSGREIAIAVTLELIVMMLIGAAIGIPLGRLTGFQLNHTYETDFFGQIDQVFPRSYAIGFLSILVTVLLAEIPGLRSAQKTDLGQVSKSQSI